MSRAEVPISTGLDGIPDPTAPILDIPTTLVEVAEIPSSKKPGILQRVRNAAGYLTRQAVVPHFLADVTDGILLDYTDFLINKAISREVFTSQGLLGNREPLMFIPGWGLSDGFFLYEEVRRAFDEEANYSAEPSGMRGRNWGNFGRRIDEVEGQLIRVYEEHNDTPVIMLGHSLGGPIIKVMINRHPDKVVSGNYLASPLDDHPEKALGSLWVEFAAKAGFLRIDEDTRAELHEATTNGASNGVAERSYIPKKGGVLNLDACRNGHVERKEGRGRSHVGSAVNTQNFLEVLRDLKQDRERMAA